MSGETKIIALGIVGIAVIAGSIFVSKSIQMDKETQENEANRQLDLEKTKIKATYPPEYWTAKAAEAAAHAEEEKARIESEERLMIDSRVRAEAEKEAIRKFELNAPAEYWEQKRIEEQEKTKREADRQRYAAEQEAARQHRKAVEETARIAEKTIKQQLGGYSTGYALL